MASYYRDNSIGTDPTSIPIIETLDVAPKVKQEKNNQEPVKKIVFTVVIVLLMLGVAGGLYYYLSLGQKNKNTSGFVLNDITLIQGQVLSDNVTDYGDFEGIDTSLCKLDTSKVDNNTPGSYTYSVKCYKTNKQAIININQFNNFKITTKIITRKVGSKITAKEFTTTNNSYTYSFIEDDDYDNLQKIGIRVVPIDVVDDEDNHQTIYGVMNVIETDYLQMMDCRKDSLVNRVVFDSNNNRLGEVLRIYEEKYETEEELTKKVLLINKGELSLGNYSGYPLIDYSKLQIRIVSAVNESLLGNEFPKTHDGIKNYYVNDNYTCS